VCCSTIIGASYWAAWLLRFEFSIPPREMHAFWGGLALVLGIKGPIFCGLHVHLEGWKDNVTFSDLLTIAQANLAGSLAAGSAILMLVGRPFPRSIYILDFMVCLLAAGGVRFLVRLLREARAELASNGNAKGVLIYGAGVAGLALAREIRTNVRLGYKVVGFVDDDPRKQGATLLGLPVLGSGESIPEIVRRRRDRRTRIEEVVVAMPSATGKQLRAAVERGRSANLPSRIVPGLGELISGKLPAGNMREVSVTDLLGRDPVHLDLEPARNVIFGRRILVTGAAGSIGSELCRQLAEMQPRELFVLDQAESPLFFLEAELRQRHPGLPVAAEVADIRNARRIEQLIEEHEFDAVLHAAAYKHVPVMERQVCEAVRNNVIGTWNLVQAAWRAGVPRFLLISTDKAVNPSSVMGLTKRTAELIVSASRPSLNFRPPSRFMSVRFGNVLVSNGSVVPIFQKQIAAGGPVTVTHPDMRRYFMTVQEAVELVLLASTMGEGSEVFVLDMGKPVRIVDLARKMIMLAGLVPDDDVEIRFVGLRPGEKLFEDLNLDAESLLPTCQERIRIFKGMQVSFDDLLPWITQLQQLLWRGDPDLVLSHMSRLVPEYQPLARRKPPEMERGMAAARVAAAGGF
jgi:FlaA1/EpsC-like NDP-sugar epimerase